MASEGVTYTRSTLLRALGDGAEDGTFLVFRSGAKPLAPDPGVMAAVAEAIGHANTLVPARSVAGGEVLRSPQGVLVPVWWGGGGREVVTSWLDGLTGQLGAAGLTGKLAVVNSRWPDLPGYGGYDQAPTAFVAFRMNEPRPDWHPFMGSSVDGPTTNRVARGAAAWAMRDRPQSGCWANVYNATQIEPADGAGFIRSAARYDATMTSLYYVTANPPLGRYLSMGALGLLSAQSVDLERGWQVMLEDLRDMLLVAPDATDLAFIKNTYCGIDLWNPVGAASFYPSPTTWPHFKTKGMRELWDQYTIDVHPVNLLTDAHLEKAHDLSDWTVEQICPGRHLVTIKDPEPWFTAKTPPDDLLAKARADFGDMIYRKLPTA